jgi:cysteine-rich repeat protein
MRATSIGSRRVRIPAAIGCLLAGLLVRPARATSPGELCAGDPCVVSGAHTVDAGSMLDFEGRDLVLAPSAVLSIGPGPDLRLAWFTAGSVTLQPGARILGGGEHATVVLVATAGNVELLASGTTRSRIDVSSTFRGEIALGASGGVVVAGLLDASGTAGGDGGTIAIRANGGDVSVAETIDARGLGGSNTGGSVSIEATGSITLADVDASGGNFFGGGSISLASGGDISLGGALDADAGPPDGEGGSISVVTTAGRVTIAGKLSTLGHCGYGSCNNGGAIVVGAGQGITIGADLVASTGCDCTGGNVDLDAGGDVIQTAGSKIASTSGSDGSGGDVSISAGGNVSLQTVDTSSSGSGGDVDIRGGRDLAVAAIDASGSAAEDANGGQVSLTGGRNVSLDTVDAAGGSGGSLSVDTGGTVTILSSLDVSAQDAEGTGGDLAVRGCDVNVSATGRLKARTGSDLPGYGTNTLVSIGTGRITIAAGATLVADDANVLRYKLTPPQNAGTIVPGATFTPDLGLGDCPAVLCGNGVLDPLETCDDGNNLSCDGCRNDCGRHDAVCGDGIVECGEGCEPPGVGPCDAGCHTAAPAIQQIAGSKAETGCFTEWEVDNPNGELGSNNFPLRTQSCTDGDPACDADGANDGTCWFRVRACSRVNDPRLALCAPGPIDFIELVAPNPVNPGSNPVNQANAATLAAALGGLEGELRHGTSVVQSGPPDATVDHCTDVMRLEVAHLPGRSASRYFSVSTTDVTPLEMDPNRVTLRCLPSKALCGDGVVDPPEECEDGNTAACDGCSPDCHLETCGNGILDCGEQCDDGGFNGTPGAACSTSCTESPPALRIPGGGGKTLDCALEFRAALHAVAVDHHGLPKNAQVCVDGDPACDFDPAPGRCSMKVWTCAGGADARLACSATAVSSVEVRAPSALQAPALRAALVSALAAVGFPVGPGERCSARVDVSAPVGKSIAVRLRGHLANGLRDNDTLKIKCRAG